MARWLFTTILRITTFKHRSFSQTTWNEAVECFPIQVPMWIDSSFHVCIPLHVRDARLYVYVKFPIAQNAVSRTRHAYVHVMGLVKETREKFQERFSCVREREKCSTSRFHVHVTSAKKTTKRSFKTKEEVSAEMNMNKLHAKTEQTGTSKRTWDFGITHVPQL